MTASAMPEGAQVIRLIVCFAAILLLLVACDKYLDTFDGLMQARINSLKCQVPARLSTSFLRP